MKCILPFLKDDGIMIIGDIHQSNLQEQVSSCGLGCKTIQSKIHGKRGGFVLNELTLFLLSCSIDARWHSLTNTLSGLFCASLNFIDETLTTQPALSFGPDDATKSTSQLRFGYLPHENVCTENLTPWIKLLPCKAKVKLLM